jgi:hypothetical protein
MTTGDRQPTALFRVKSLSDAILPSRGDVTDESLLGLEIV